MNRLKPAKQVNNTRRAGPPPLAPVLETLAWLLHLEEGFQPLRPAQSSSVASSARSPAIGFAGDQATALLPGGEGRSCGSALSSAAFPGRSSHASRERMSEVGPTRARVRAWIGRLRTWAEAVLSSPEQVAGEGGQHRVEAHQLQALAGP